MDLDPCPFCGSEKTRLERKLDDGLTYWWVICDDCGACGPLDLKARRAIEGWSAAPRFDTDSSPKTEASS